ncbi:E3 SUMO-protein ligase ZBED1-like [Panonychus citri]|uniref:E3 SUMO-protein ligase ZBED1-like n=1 Tax=Panonychus citri TaxID=50023 RepID=UPI0023074488|nr:E3 SUMO-protein ligase ZBED1-like [Panonychus citri]
MPKIRSKVWEHFQKDEKHGKAYCRYCSSTLVINNPSNLNKHLRSKHPVIYAAKKAAVDLGEPAQVVTIAQPGIASIKGSSVSSTPQKSPESRKTGNSQENIVRSILKFIAKDNVHVNIVNGEGFSDLIKDLVPCYSPITSKLARNKLDHHYDILFHKKKTELAKVEHISLTADNWVEPNTSTNYLNVTAHYIGNDGRTKSVLISCRPFNENQTAQNIKSNFEEILGEWNIPAFKIVCLVTDGEANLLESGQIWPGKGRNFVCFAHRLNLAVRAALEATTDVIAVLEKVKGIVDVLIREQAASDELARVFEHEGKNYVKLVQCVDTRFTSIYKMVERFIACYDFVSLALTQSYGGGMVTSQEKDILMDILAVLKPLQLVADELCGEKYPTLSKVIPITLCLKRALENVSPITDSGLLLKQACFETIQAKIGDPEFATIAAVSTILDPRFKNIDFQHPTACSNALRIVNDYLNTRSTTTEVRVEQPATHLLWSHHDKLASNISIDQSCNNSLHPSLKTYLESPISHRFSDPVAIWHEIGFDKHLKNYALKHLSVPATSVSPEILFTKHGDLVDYRRSQIKPKRLQKLLFLNSLSLDELRGV